MNMQEGVQVSVASSTAASPAPANGQRIMPVLYVNQPTIKSVSPATPSVSSVVSSTSGPTIITAMPQIQFAGGGNSQILHSSPNPNTYSYVPVQQVYHQAKTIKDPPKKVFVTSLNSGPNNKSNQVNLMVSKPALTRLIVPQIGSGMFLPNSSSSGNSNKQTVTSLLLPTNAKYPNIAPNKKVPIPNIVIPQQLSNNKPTNVPNIIRQSNNPTNKNVVGIFSSPSNQTNPQMTSLLLTPNANSKNKPPPTSVGLILPASGGSHVIMPQSSSGQTLIMPQTSSGQSHSIIMPQSSNGQSHSIMGQSQGIIVPQSTGGQTQVTNLILTSSTTSIPNSTNTPVASLLISNNSSSSSSVGSSHMTSLLIPQNSSGCSSPGPGNTSTSGLKTSILVPVSVGPNKSSMLQSTTQSNGKKSQDTNSLITRENKQSVVVKAGAEGNLSSLPSLPPLQPISVKEGLTRAPNGLNVPESLIMTPITDIDLIKNKHEKISDDMTIERTSCITMDNKGTSTGSAMNVDEDVSISMTTVRGSDRDEGVVLDGEVTVRRLGPHKEEVPERKLLDDDVKIELVKPIPERQKPPAPRYQKPEDLNPMEVLEWDHQGVGKLPGSNIKFRINEYGLDLVVDSNKDESSSNTPNSSRRNSDDKPLTSEIKQDKEVLGEGTDKIYCCEGCGCYGLYTEFLMDTRFCSVGCKKIVLARAEIKRKRQDDKLRELRLRRKRRKIRLMAQQAKRDSMDQRGIKESQDDKDEAGEEAELISKAWSSRMVELRKAKRMQEGNIKINMSDSEDPRGAMSPFSVSEASEGVSRSPPASITSEDDTSMDRTGQPPVSDACKETWVTSSGEFLWSVYLLKCCNKAKSAPVKLFKEPYPYGKNGFKVGMKLEGIDPEHQAIISVLTVSQIKGHRLRLHFDGFPDCHDFWANSDSPDIFPPGWCERNNHTLDPPRGYTNDNFSWNTYLKQCRAQPAPKSLFPKSNTPLCPSQFRVGMKLEAVDRKNSSLICVASVSNLIDNRLLIHFDSWGDVYDYWTDPSSPYIHPVGWCEENGHDLTPPNTYKNPSLFSWELYLKETKTLAAPARAFKPRPPNSFRRGMKLEAVDRRAPALLRPATVREVKDYQIKITFDGYPEEFGYWVDDDCTDIHPTGWGQKSGHPITPPPMASTRGECGTMDCTGDGNIKGGFLSRHNTAALCPYSPQNLNKDTVPDRFCMNPDFYEVPEPIGKSKSNSSSIKDADDSTCSESRVKTRYSSNASLKDDCKEDSANRMEPEEKTEERVERRGRKRKVDMESPAEQLDRLRRELIHTVLEPGYKPAPEEQEMWVKHVATLGHKVNVTGGDPRAWNHKQVAAFVNTVIPSRAKLFLDQEIDGESFLMLTQCDLTKVLGLKLGPALKIYNCIILLRQKVMTL